MTQPRRKLDECWPPPIRGMMFEVITWNVIPCIVRRGHRVVGFDASRNGIDVVRVLLLRSFRTRQPAFTSSRWTTPFGTPDDIPQAARNVARTLSELEQIRTDPGQV